MRMNYKVLETRIVEIWPLEEVKNYLRVSHRYDDRMIRGLIQTAIESAEKFTSLSLYPRRVECNIENVASSIDFKYSPIIEINALVIKIAGAEQNILDDYGHIETDTQTVHFTSKYVGKDLKITYRAGYKNNIPRAVQHGILMHVAAMYDNPGGSASINSGVKDLYIPYRRLKI